MDSYNMTDESAPSELSTQFQKITVTLLSAILLGLLWIGFSLQQINSKVELSDDHWSSSGIKVHVDNQEARPLPVQLVNDQKWDSEAHRYTYSYYGNEPIAVKLMSDSEYSTNGATYSYQTPFPVKIYTGYGRDILGKYGDTFDVPIPIRVAE